MKTIEKNVEKSAKNDAVEQTISEQRGEIFEGIYGVSRMVDILKLFKKDYNACKSKSVPRVQALYRDYSYAIFFLYSPSSIRNNLVKFKNIIRECGGKYQAIALECFDIANIYAPIKKKDVERKVKLKEAVLACESYSTNSNSKENAKIVEKKISDLKTLLDAKDYIVRGNQHENQVRAYYILAILGLATGRRFTELLKTLKISKRNHVVYFEGLLKNNLEKIEGHIISLEYKDVQRYLRELRRFAETDGLTEARINHKYAKVFNGALKRIGFINVKTLRHNYSVAGSHLFKRPGESVEDTITRILGHRETFTSALNYT